MIIVDVETSGVNPKMNSIVSIGAVNFLDPQDQFYGECRVWDGAEIAEIALKVNGFTVEQLKDPKKKSVEELIGEFAKWLESFENKTLAGQNPTFDRDFLNASAKRAGRKMLFWRRAIDLHAICYAHMLGRRLDVPVEEQRSAITSDMAFNYVGLPKEPRPHNALTGAKMEAESFSRLIYGKSLLKEFETHAVPRYLL